MSRERQKQKVKDKDVGGCQKSTGESEVRTSDLGDFMCSIHYVRWTLCAVGSHVPSTLLLLTPSLERYCCKHLVSVVPLCKHLVSVVPLCWKGLVADILPMTFICQTSLRNLPRMLSETFKDLGS